MNICLALSHAIEEFDMLRLLSGIGADVFSIGGYINPAEPHDPIRPALPDVPFHPELKAAVDGIGAADNLGAAQSRYPDAVLEWADVILVHHQLDRLFNQWARVRDWKRGASSRRIVWRSVGQSVAGNEHQARPFRAEGLERVAYSPKEANIPGYSGHDALIRFYKDPTEYTGWTGEDPVVVNFTQHAGPPDPPGARDEWVNWGFWREATQGLPAKSYGRHSERTGGEGMLPPEDMIRRLQTARAYLYTGTQPASYTLGLIEAMMVGVPVVSIGPEHMRIFAPYGRDLFEGHEITLWSASDPAAARRDLSLLLESDDTPDVSRFMRHRAIDLFGKDKIAAQWAEFLGLPSESQPKPVEVAA